MILCIMLVDKPVHRSLYFHISTSKELRQIVRVLCLFFYDDFERQSCLNKVCIKGIRIIPVTCPSCSKKETGRTLTEHINLLRISRARRMLRETALQVQTVAQHCGIHDVNYFSKVFKKYTGKTPLQYRKEA